MNKDDVSALIAKLILSVAAIDNGRNAKRHHGWEVSLWWPDAGGSLFIARTRAPDGRTWLRGVQLESKSKSPWMKDKVWRVDSKTAVAWGAFVVRLASLPVDNAAST